jgi:hypothetical protein
MNKHTPAPWEIRGNTIFVPNTYKSVAIVTVQENFDFVKWKPKEDVEQIANAKIIAAAAELLEACMQVVNDYETDGMEGMRNRDKIFYEICKSAIKKATE